MVILTSGKKYEVINKKKRLERGDSFYIKDDYGYANIVFIKIVVTYTARIG